MRIIAQCAPFRLIDCTKRVKVYLISDQLGLQMSLFHDGLTEIRRHGLC